MEEFQQEGFVVELQKMGKATKSAPYPQHHHRWAHWVNSVLKITPEFVKIQFAETHSKLRYILHLIHYQYSHADLSKENMEKSLEISGTEHRWWGLIERELIQNFGSEGRGLSKREA